MTVGAAELGYTVQAPAPHSMSLARETWRRFARNRGAVAGLGVVLVYLAMAVFADVLAPYSPVDGDLSAKLVPPTLSHPLGTDELGRDLLSRLLFGARSSLEIQLAAVVFALVIGVTWGLVA